MYPPKVLIGPAVLTLPDNTTAHIAGHIDRQAATHGGYISKNSVIFCLHVGGNRIQQVALVTDHGRPFRCLPIRIDFAQHLRDLPAVFPPLLFGGGASSIALCQLLDINDKKPVAICDSGNEFSALSHRINAGHNRLINFAHVHQLVFGVLPKRRVENGALQINQLPK